MRLKLKWLYSVKAFAYVILGIAAIVALLGGIYILSPVFASIAAGYNETSPILSGLVEFGAIPVFGGLLTGVPVLIFAGMKFRKPKWVNHGAFILSMIYIFLAALRLFSIGLFPLVWLNLLAFGLIVALCRLVLE